MHAPPLKATPEMTCLLSQSSPRTVHNRGTLTYVKTADLRRSVFSRACAWEGRLLAALPVLLLQLDDLLLKVLCCEVAARCEGKLFDALQQSGFPDVHHSHHILLVLRNACSKQDKIGIVGTAADIAQVPKANLGGCRRLMLRLHAVCTLPKEALSHVPWTWAAMYRAAPQMPEGRRPVCIQSRFMLATRRSAVLVTSANLSRTPRRSAKRCRYRLGSTGLAGGQLIGVYTGFKTPLSSIIRRHAAFICIAMQT